MEQDADPAPSRRRRLTSRRRSASSGSQDTLQISRLLALEWSPGRAERLRQLLDRAVGSRRLTQGLEHLFAEYLSKMGLPPAQAGEIRRSVRDLARAIAGWQQPIRHAPSLQGLWCLSRLTGLSIDNLVGDPWQGPPAVCWYMARIEQSFLDQKSKEVEEVENSEDPQRLIELGKEVARNTNVLAASENWLHLHNVRTGNASIARSIEDLGKWIQNRSSVDAAEKAKQRCYEACFRGAFGPLRDKSGMIPPMAVTISRGVRLDRGRVFQIPAGDYYMTPVFEQVELPGTFAGRTYLILYMLMPG